MYKRFIHKNKNIPIHILNRQRFIRDKLDNILSSSTKEYLKLEKEMQNELKMRHNNTFKHKIR